jgi:hypothetical protein
MGSIIIAVAVLLIHMLMNPVANMNPRIIPFPEVPVIRMRFNAMRHAGDVFPRARAIIKPPRKRKIIGFAYGAAASRIFKTPNNGNTQSGIKEVTGIGTASATHQVTIQAATARTLFAPAETNVSVALSKDHK